MTIMIVNVRVHYHWRRPLKEKEHHREIPLSGFLVRKLSYCDHPLKITVYELFSGKRMKYHFPLQYFVKPDKSCHDLYYYDYNDNSTNYQVPFYFSEVITSTLSDTQGQQCQPWHGSLKSRAKKDYHPILTPDCNPAFTQSLLSLC